MHADGPASNAFAREVSGRFGVLPNFFRSAGAGPGLIEELWGFARSAYLDNALPPLLMERLFVHLSRFSEARYCIVRHVGFLIGEGRPAGDAKAPAQTVEDALALLRRPVPDRDGVDQACARLLAMPPAGALPAPGTAAEADLFDALSLIFLSPARSTAARAAVRHAAGDAAFERLAAFLAFVRTAHYWTETHPEITYEPDMLACMAEHPELARLMLDAGEAEAESLAAVHHRLDMAEATLAQREADIARVQRIGEIGGLDIDVAGGLGSRRSPEYLRLHGLGPESIQESHAQWLARVHPEDRDRAEHGLFAALGGPDSVYDAEYRIVRPSDGAVRWIHARADIERDAAGKAVRLVGAHLDVTERKRLEQAARESERRQAFLLRLSDALRPLADPIQAQRLAMRHLAEHLGVMRAAYFEMAPDQDAFTQSATYETDATPLPEGLRLSDFGSSIERTYHAGQTFVVEDTELDERIAPQRRAYRAIGVRAWIGVPLIKAGRVVSILGVHEPAPRAWTDADIRLVEDVAERLWAAVERARAEAALRESESRLQLLVAELQHRVRNILTVVRSVFSRTVEAGGDIDDIVDHFRGRLDSLGRTQVVVTQTPDGRVDLENLIRDELLSVGLSDGLRLSIKGPDVSLLPVAAESIGLAIHELTTNALKYGAFKFPGARLDISWSANMDYGSDRRLHLTWLEQGVPAVPLQPPRRGFGSELIEEALPYRLGAETRFEFRGGGVRCAIIMPLPGEEAAATGS